MSLWTATVGWPWTFRNPLHCSRSPQCLLPRAIARRYCPPWHQARQHLHHQAWTCQDSRLRARKVDAG